MLQHRVIFVRNLPDMMTAGKIIFKRTEQKV